jgi:hypothetical protein
MAATIPQGPVLGPALFVASGRTKPAARRAQPPASARVARRRIGLGPRAILVTNPACKSTPRKARLKVVPRRRARRLPLYAGFIGSVLFSAAAFGLSFAVDTPRTLMSRSDFVLARQAIQDETRAALGRCRSVEMPAREVCRVEARAAERVHRAELDARYHGTVAAAAEVRVVRAKADFEVARARCNSLASAERLECLQAARTTEAKAVAAARPAAT